MRLVRASTESVILNVAEGERHLFTRILSLYPVVPEAYQPLSRSTAGRDAGEEQKLLNEALAEQREALRRRVQEWLHAGNRFRPVRAGFNFTLLRADAEWLLQVLNDIRVGHWLLLGAPEDLPDAVDVRTLPPALHRAWMAMEMGGMFQMAILCALEFNPLD